MKHASFQKFIDLVAFDTRFLDLQKQIESAQKSIQESMAQRKMYQDKIDAAAAKKNEAHKLVKDNELEIQSLEEKENIQKAVLDNVVNVKEQKAAQKELEAVQFKRNSIEQSLSRDWNRYEILNKEFSAIEVEANETMQKFDAEIQKYKTEIVEAQQSLHEYNLDRQVKLEGIKAEWLYMYDIMKGRSTNPVVPVSQESCSVCFYMIGSQDLQQLKQGELLHCKDCYRLLYFPDLVETQEHLEVA